MRSLQKIKPFRWGIELILITIFQLISFTEVMLDAGENSSKFILIFFVFLVVEWAYTLLMRISIKQTSFELEFISFFLSGIGLSLVATLDSDFLADGTQTQASYAAKQLLYILAGLVCFMVLRWVIANTDRVAALRPPVAVISGAILAANIVLGQDINGAKNWITIGGFSFQPSEIVKVLFIFVGAATLDKLQTTRSVIKYIIFSVGCIGALFIMRDFGTAVVFFVTFLIITFMRSGDIRTILLICIAALVGAFLIIFFKPYVAERFSTYRHIWETPYGEGMQQTRVLIYSASGGLFGLGLGQGMLRETFAATTDLVFGMVCEEYGMIIAFAIIISFAAIVVYTVAGAKAARSSFYAIAACSAAGLLLVQLSLNVFGVTDLLPLTGVTLPFISRGGSSMISCWMLMAFIKSIDPRAYPKTLKETQALG
ncbi:MAG: FtsW/RodA/SpoVE family cell cycle protein [Clostridia bacterium]|nr:FtsW/RodA/SpoVE family cell cycle protein [Clostridia bacterium]